MNPYAPQQRPFQQRTFQQQPAQQLPALPTVRQHPVQQHGVQHTLPRPRFQPAPPQRPWSQPPVQPPPVFRQLPVHRPPLLPTDHQHPAGQRAPHPALIIAFGVLVAALVVTTVLLVRGSSAQQPVRSAVTPPTPPVVLSATAPISTAPKSTEPTTTEPTTTEPTTTEPTTTEPTTSRPTTSSGGKTAVVRAAHTAAQAWARAVNAGDAEGVLAHSCRQDVKVYGNGELTNPGRLRGKYTFQVQELVALTGTGTAAVVRFSVSPDLGSQSTLDSYVTQQSGRWLVCISVTKRADL